MLLNRKPRSIRHLAPAPTPATATTSARRPRLTAIAVAVNVVSCFVGGTRLAVGKLVVANRLGLDVFFAEHFGHRVERGNSVVKIRDVQEARLLEPNIHERRLHPGQHARDLALIDIASQPNLPIALEEKFGELVIFKQRDPHFQFGCVNCDFSFHRCTLYSGESDKLGRTMMMRRESSSRGRRELSEKPSRTLVHRFTLCIDNLCRIIRGTPDLRKQAR